MNSCIYEGQVRHRRFSPSAHKFRYRLFYMYIDLDEADSIFYGQKLRLSGWFSALRFRRNDYLGDCCDSLKDKVLDIVHKKTGARPDGPVRLLTQFRFFGFIFNPVSFYYCYDKSGHQLEAILAEITNTPWNERHQYVIPVNHGLTVKSHYRFQFDKEFHVSPFMPLRQDYDWRFTCPDDRLTVHMINYKDNKKVFDATLVLKKHELNRVNLIRMQLRYPFMTLKIITGIYWQALRLFLKKTPFYTHPDKLKGGASSANPT